MTGALPYYRVIEHDGLLAEVRVTDIDLGEVVISMARRYVGTGAGDEIIRRAIARRRANREAASDGES